MLSECRKLPTNASSIALSIEVFLPLFNVHLLLIYLKWCVFMLYSPIICFIVCQKLKTKLFVSLLHRIVKPFRWFHWNESFVYSFATVVKFHSHTKLINNKVYTCRWDNTWQTKVFLTNFIKTNYYHGNKKKFRTEK